jgi:phage gpG-like protein
MPSAKRAVLGNLGMHNISRNPGIGVTLESTIGITAAKVDKLGLDIRSFRVPLTRSVQKVMAPSFVENFNHGGRPDPWEPLSDATREIHQRMGWEGGSVLVLTGKLRRVMGQLNIWTINTKAAIIKGLPESVWYGEIHQGGYEGSSSMSALIKKTGSARAALEHIQAQQRSVLANATLGRTVGKGKTTGSRTLRVQGVGSTMRGGGAASIPARPFIMFQDEDQDRVTEVFIEWLGERMAAAGFAVTP